jgi:oligopeptide/dipeptide ABC transporter ATP-binding protein
MYRGGICEIGTTADVLASPRHPYTQALLASVPQVETGRTPRRLPHEAVEAAAEPLKGCRFAPRCPHKLDVICEAMAPALRPLSPTRSVACHLVTPPVDTVDFRGFRTTSMRLWSSAHNSFGAVVAIVKLHTRSPASERQVSHKPVSAIRRRSASGRHQAAVGQRDRLGLLAYRLWPSRTVDLYSRTAESTRPVTR